MRRQLSLFGLALLIPILGFIGFVLFQYSYSERSHLEDDALDGAREIAVSVDRQIANLVSAMNVLALSPLLLADDLEGFHRQLVQMRDRRDVIAILRDSDGQQLINPRRPYGAPLPKSLLEGEEEAALKGSVFVSNTYLGIVSNTQLFSVSMPIVRDGKRKYLLSLSLPVERIRDIILAAKPPSDWIVSVVDRKGAIVARNVDHGQYSGRPADPDLLANTPAREGIWNGSTIDGQPAFGAYARSTFADWRVAVSVRESVLEAPLRRSLLIFASVGLGLAGLSLIFASIYARRIVSPMEDLTQRAAALGRGEAVAPLRSRVHEINLVGDAMVGASGELRERENVLRNFNEALEKEVAARTAELVAANEKLVEEAANRERVEEQFRQAQKMEAVGQLTGGIAHDFNNLLAVITGNLDLLVRRVNQGRPNIERFAENALEAAQRAATLTHRLLAFSRQQPLTPEPIDVNRLVAGMHEILQRALGEDIETETELAAGLWRTHADPNQLESAILNLAVNARDAMPGGGKLTIETANTHIDGYHAAEHGIAEGQYVLIAVSDTGEGMTPGTIARAFEPFFTTKGPSQGTGLGLSQVYGFVRQTGGQVKIYSEPKMGTTIKIYLPRFLGPAGEAEPFDVPTVEAPTGNEAILVVEDEDKVRRINADTLRELGYRAFEAENAAVALRILDANPDITLLFTDIVMPETNGHKLAEEALRRRPKLKVLFTTGYTRDAAAHNGVVDSGVQLLVKPFTMKQLASKVRDVLDAASAA